MLISLLVLALKDTHCSDAERLAFLCPLDRRDIWRAERASGLSEGERW